MSERGREKIEQVITDEQILDAIDDLQKSGVGPENENFAYYALEVLKYGKVGHRHDELAINISDQSILDRIFALLSRVRIQ